MKRLRALFAFLVGLFRVRPRALPPPPPAPEAAPEPAQAPPRVVTVVVTNAARAAVAQWLLSTRWSGTRTYGKLRDSLYARLNLSELQWEVRRDGSKKLLVPAGSAWRDGSEPIEFTEAMARLVLDELPGAPTDGPLGHDSVAFMDALEEAFPG